MNTGSRARWVALAVVCTGSLMNVLDTTIVGVALPAIHHDLGFSQASLAWVVNAYLLAFGGFLLLGGRLGDLFGHRRLFTAGIGVFTLASLACGLATGPGFLLAGRAVQGVAGAIASAVALSLVVSLFPEPGERAKALGVYGLASAGGGSIGVLLGGVLTSAGQVGWASVRVLVALAAAALALAAFAVIEGRTAAPLVPLRLFRMRNLTVASLTGVLWSASMFACFFLTTLYLQLVLHYSPLRTGLAFLPMNLVMSGLSAGAAARLVARFGIKPPLVTGLALAAAGLALLGHAPVGGHFATDVLPGALLLGIGAGTALPPLLLAATGDLPPSESGLASGVASTAFMLGGAFGLAVLASLATTRTRGLLAAGQGHLTALTSGYHAAFLAGAACAALAALAAAAGLRPAMTPAGSASTPAAEPALATRQ